MSLSDKHKGRKMLLSRKRLFPIVLQAGSTMKKSFAVFFVFLFASIGFSAPQTQEYVLQAGDVISVQVVEHPEFSGRHKIRPDGRINYPVIGEIEVASLTCAQLVNIMERKLASYVNNAVVSVSIEAYYANKIYIIGDVQSTGQFEIYEPVDIQKALAMCGGLKNLKVKSIKIIRADGSITDIPASKIWTSEVKRTSLLYPGDTMYVPETFTIPWAAISTVLSIISMSLTITLTIITLSSNKD
jgi:polysaccharide export outer membrane protein